MSTVQAYSLQQYKNINNDIVLEVLADGTIVLETGVTISSGTGSPEGVVTAPVGSLYIQSDGVVPNILWQKQTGIGNTGWMPSGGAAASPNTSVQFNNAGAFAGDAALEWNNTVKGLGVGPQSTAGQLDSITSGGSPSGQTALDVAISFGGVVPDNTAVAAALSMEAAPPVDGTTNYYANFNTANVASGNTHAMSLMASISAAATHFGTGLIGILEGIEIFSLVSSTGNVTTNTGIFVSAGSNTGSTGTMQTCRGIAVLSGAQGSGTISSNVGISIAAPFVVGVLTHNYGIKIEDQTPGGSNNPDSYAIHSSGGKMHFAGLGAHANNAAAIAAGLVAGDLYRTGADPDVICVVH